MANEDLYNPSKTSPYLPNIPNIPDVCVKCLSEKGTLIHSLWECSKILAFWGNVIKCLSRMAKCNTPLRSTICILGIYPKDFTRTKKQSEMIDFGLFTCKENDCNILERCRTAITGNMEEGVDNLPWTGETDEHC